MAFLRITLCAAFMLTVVLSKPVSEAEDSSNESSETNSSEEATIHVQQRGGALQSASEEQTAAISIEETESPGTVDMLPAIDASPSPAELNASALPDLMDPQTSTDTGTPQPMQDEVSQTTAGTLIFQNMPSTDPVLDSTIVDTHVQKDSEVSLNTGLTETHGTNQPQVTTTTTYQGLTPDATAFFSPHINPSPQPFSTSPPVSVPIKGTGVTAVPVCFTVQFATSEPEPVRGDNM
ncbi:mucin-2-like [Notolabrus celidotus]|uniref:mucin-2-like n=1 Tax=Notolabrus celidotus TaxID=1203425 RepID=UPI00148F7D86|nr:mucin-2-like [Notolabrus celidotus]